MPIPVRHRATFAPGSFYHVYNRSVHGTPLFASPANYQYFLEKLNTYLGDVWDVFAFCLLPTHFHFLVQVKTTLPDTGSEPLHEAIIRRYKNFCLSYSHAYKKQMGIQTNIFSQHFKRILINEDAYFTQLVFYIHLNPLHHQLGTHWARYPWSSYQRILIKGTLPGAAYGPYAQVLGWFGGPEAYVRYHHQQEVVYDGGFDLPG